MRVSSAIDADERLAVVVLFVNTSDNELLWVCMVVVVVVIV